MSEHDYIDLDKLADDPEMSDHIKNILSAASSAKNTISNKDFARYEILFRLNGRELIGSDRFDELASEYYTKIDPYSPVSIVDHTGTVLFVLPAMFRKVRPVNYAGQAGMDANMAFINANNLDDPFGTKRKTYCNMYKAAIAVAQNAKEKEQAIATAAKLTQSVVRTDTDTKDDTTPAVDMMGGSVEII